MLLSILRHSLAAALVLATLAPLCAQAELGPPQPPIFQTQETELINRNELLKRVLANDPWAARRILDALATQPGKAFVPPDGVDPFSNPDLRASPEAAYDLFQLLKQAAADKPGKTPK